MPEAQAPRGINSIESHDHSRIVALPEYIAAQKALDALAHVIEGTRAAWLDTVQDMAVVLPVSDHCPQKDDHDWGGDDRYWTAAPYRVDATATRFAASTTARSTTGSGPAATPLTSRG